MRNLFKEFECKSDWTAADVYTAAVSALKMFVRKSTEKKPLFSAKQHSSSLKPPSGPINKDATIFISSLEKTFSKYVERNLRISTY